MWIRGTHTPSIRCVRGWRWLCKSALQGELNIFPMACLVLIAPVQDKVPQVRSPELVSSRGIVLCVRFWNICEVCL